MNIKFIGNNFLLALIPVIMLVCSCQKKFSVDDYSAYIQGEVMNPNSNYILFCKDNQVLDTLFLDKDNKFSKKFDSLTPGMYIYRHTPEYQYVYFDKNDSLTLRLNTRDFDHSIIFTGRGAEKNNFLMNLTVRNLVDETTRYENFDLPVDAFIRKIDSTHAARTTYYLKSKAIIGWQAGFDLYAKTKLDLHFFSQKEIYPVAHYIRTGQNIKPDLPVDYYAFRKKVDYNNEDLIQYSSYTRYLSIMLNSIINESEIDFNPETKLDNNIEKLNIVDTLIQNKKVKNTILDNITYIYLLEDQNLNNNDKFLERYFELSTDSSEHKEIISIQKAVQNLKYENKLPEVALTNTQGEDVNINKIITKPTLMFVWSKNALAHAEGAHRRALHILHHNPNLQVISVCIDGEQQDWKNFIQAYSDPNLIKLRSTDFKEMKEKWIITKIQRTMILNQDGTIKDAFVNIFDKNIEAKIVQ
ncbi:TlpA family protein disulfide reductase [Myroides sp. LJL119]